MRVSIASTPQELQVYWATLCVELHSPILPSPDIDDEDRRLIAGYFQHLGVTAPSEADACEFAAAEVPDGEIAWRESGISRVEAASLDSEVLSRSGDWSENGVWYKSGRIFFPEEIS